MYINGRYIKERRREVGFTRSQLAKKLDITYDYLKRIENGQRRPGLVLTVKISSILKIPLEKLLTKE